MAVFAVFDFRDIYDVLYILLFIAVEFVPHYRENREWRNTLTRRKSRTISRHINQSFSTRRSKQLQHTSIRKSNIQNPQIL